MLAPKLNFIFYKTNTTDFWESIFQLNLGCFKLVHETFCLNKLCRNITITDQTKEKPKPLYFFNRSLTRFSCHCIINVAPKKADK